MSKHVDIARSEGIEAGLAAFLKAPASRIHGSYHEIVACKTQAQKVARYKKLYKDQIGAAPKAPSVKSESLTSLTEEFNEMKALLKRLTSSVEVSEPAEVVEVVKPKRGRKPRSLSAQATAVIQAANTKRTFNYSKHDIWVLLGSNPDITLTNPDEAATAKMLWRANQEGVL